MTLTFRRRRHATRLPRYQIAAIKPLGQSPEIESHLSASGVWEQAQYRLEEIHYYVEDEAGRRKDFCAAGWLNELGYWQVSAPGFNGCLCHPALTIIPGSSEEAWLFGEMFDYLRHPETGSAKATIIILNSERLKEAGLAVAKSFKTVRTFLDSPLTEP